MHPSTAFLLCLLLPFACYAASTINATIDDFFGDSLTKQVPLYLPSEAWANQSCSGCAIKPNASKAFMDTYIGATFHPELLNVSISMGFEGIAIYVFFILPNNQGDGVTVDTAVNFTIDGEIVGNFEHKANLSTKDFIFDQMVFSKTDLVSGVHQLVISTSGLNISTFTNFDYAIYTKEVLDVTATSQFSSTASSSNSAVAIQSLAAPSSTTAKKPTIAIVGAAIGGILFVGVIVLLLIWRRIHKQRSRPRWKMRTRKFPRIQKPWERVQSPFLVSGYSHQRTSSEATIVAPNEPLGLFSANDLERNFTSNQPSSSSTSSFLGRIFRYIGLNMESSRDGRNIQQTGNTVAQNVQATRSATQTDEISQMRAQVQAMQAQIELLRLQQYDAWIAELSNEPPPGYDGL